MSIVWVFMDITAVFLEYWPAKFPFQFGNKVGKAKVAGTPTYTYPQELKTVARGVLVGNIKDYPDPTHAKVTLNIGTLSKNHKAFLDFWRGWKKVQ